MRTFITTLIALLFAACGGSKSANTASDMAAAVPSVEQVLFAVRSAEDDSTRNDDVCKFVDDVALGEPGEDGMVDVPANHPDILYFGRVDCTDPLAPSFSFPGVSIRARFTGTKLDMRLKDYAFKRTNTTTNYYNIIIDGGEPTVLAPKSSQLVYELARDLAPGEHTVEIFKRTESSNNGDMNVGRGDFLGLRIEAGGKILPLAAKPNRIEFIGDSITCGYGNEIAVQSPDNYHYTSANADAYMAWGAIAARRLNAEYMAVAYSGKGVTRNYAGHEGPVIPDVYLKSLPDDDDAAPWDTSVHSPGVVVVNLGTNDFSIGVEPDNVPALRERYRSAYLAFVTRLRQYYPNAVLVLALGTMMSDFFPEGYNAWTAAQEEVTAVVAARHRAGDTNVHMLVMEPQWPPFGEDYHPARHTHERMAEELVQFLVRIGAVE